MTSRDREGLKTFARDTVREPRGLTISSSDNQHAPQPLDSGGAIDDDLRDALITVKRSAEGVDTVQSLRDTGRRSDAVDTIKSAFGDKVDVGRGGYNVHDSRNDQTEVDKARLGSPDGRGGYNVQSSRA